jgi:hypothetical protein
VSGNIGKYPKRRREAGDADGDMQMGNWPGWSLLPIMDMRPMGAASD